MGKNLSRQNCGILSEKRNEIMGIAALMIVLFHFAQMSNLFTGPIKTILLTLCSGVEIFIIISGMGLYYSFQKKPNIKDFYKKRIYNVYFIFLIISLPYTIFWSIVNSKLNLVLLNWLVPNYALGNARDVWYVPFILVMYLLYPLVHKFLFNEKIYKFRYLMVLSFSVLWYGLYYVLLKSGNEYFLKIEIGFFRFPWFLISCLIGEIVYNKIKFSKAMLIVPILSILSIVFMHLYINNNFGMRMVDMLAAVVYLSIIILFFCLFNLSFINKILCFFGSISLELYLVHLLLFKVLTYYEIYNWLYYIILIAISIVLSYPLSLLRQFFVKNIKLKKI